MWFIVKILWTWNLFFTLLEISKPFFFPFLAMPLSQLLKKKNLFPYFGNDIAAIAFFFILRALYTRAHTDTQHSAGKLGSGISSIPLPKFNIFSLPSLLLFPFPYSLSCFLFSLLLFGWISAMSLPKFSLSPHFPNYLWTVHITQINFKFYNINPKDS